MKGYDERVNGGMKEYRERWRWEEGRERKKRGKEAFGCILSINTEVAKLLEATHRLCVCGEAQV